MNKNTENKYPTLKVITLYPLLGGVIYCAIVLSIIYPMILSEGVKFSLEYFYFHLMGFSFIGFILNLIISFIFIILKIKTINKNYAKIFGIGFVVYFLSSFRFFYPNMIPNIVFVLVCGLLGGLLSTILAKFILPKS
ncbi:MAG: hypothetical protein Q3971_09520 [Moraxella sp.]|nr:hypothetical protein [Moraxella sp.]